MDSLVKICGLRNTETAVAAIDTGADALGFMLARSKRQIPPDEIPAILAALRPDQRTAIRAVGVVVNESAATINALRSQANLDVMQLSGDESPELLELLDGPVWKTLRFAPGTTVEQASETIEPWFDHRTPVELVLVDAAVTGAYGGTGHRADWDLAAQLALRYRVMLAGGLDPTNVETAVGQVRPLGVDVSSGVERDGQKDPQLITQFVQRAKRAFYSPGR